MFFILFVLFAFQNNLNKKLVFKISLLFLFIFSGFRIVKGKDDASYINIFNLLKLDQLKITETMQEPIFTLILKFCIFAGISNQTGPGRPLVAIYIAFSR